MSLPTSPLSSPPRASQSFSKAAATGKALGQYKPVRPLPFELGQHIQTYYEESLFTQAYGFLLSILSNSASSANKYAPVIVPPPSHLALAATLAVHPILTTRTRSHEKREQANAAFRLLRLVNNTAGPINAGFSAAFSFKKYDFRSSRHGGSRFDDHDEDDYSPPAVADQKLNTPFAGPESIWTRAEDLWQVVGWAFNCSCLPGIYAARWGYWRLWLQFLLDVLETDWHIRCRTDRPEESLLWQYIELAPGGNARSRRVLRAIFADGSSKSLNEFREVFRHELKEPANEADRMKKREGDVNVEAEVYGDYMAQDESDLSEEGEGDHAAVGRPSKRLRTRTPSAHRVTPRTSAGSLRSEYENDPEGDAMGSTSNLGGSDALQLRLRLLSLLSPVSAHPTLTSTSPTTFPDLEELHTLFVEFIKPLPLGTFLHIVAPYANDVFPPHTLSALCESLLQRMLESSAPSIRSERLLTQTKLEVEYLPFAAGKNSVDANARVSLLLEALLRTLAADRHLRPRQQLMSAVEKGIERRTSRAAEMGDKRRKGGKAKTNASDEDEAWNWLVESGERMRIVVNGLAD